MSRKVGVIIIIIEFFKICFWFIARFFFWIITARDCEHCKHYQRGILYGFVCKKRTTEMLDCLNSIKRKYFERQKENQ